MKRRNFSESYKVEAVRLVKEQGRSIVRDRRTTDGHEVLDRQECEKALAVDTRSARFPIFG